MYLKKNHKLKILEQALALATPISHEHKMDWYAQLFFYRRWFQEITLFIVDRYTAERMTLVSMKTFEVKRVLIGVLNKPK